jgi:hypothetical protein
MTECDFGRVENLTFPNGQPCVDPSVRIVRTARLGGGGGTRLPSSDDFELNHAIRELFEELGQLKDGLIIRLEFRRSLPCLLETAVTARPADWRSPPDAEGPGA